MYSVPASTNPGLVYSQLWARYVGVMQAMKAALTEMQDRERTDLDIAERYAGCFESCEHTYQRRLADKAESIVKVLTRIAAQRFAPEGGHAIEIRKDYREGFIDEDSIESFEPVLVWAQMEKDLGGANGVELGYRQAAEKLVRAFHIRKGMELKTIKDRVVLDYTLYHYEKHYDQRTTLGLSGGEDSMHACLTALKTVVMWAGLDPCGKFEWLAREWGYSGKGFVSRGSVAVSDDVEVITFLSRFEFRFSQALASKLQEFISLYGAEYLRDAA